MSPVICQKKFSEREERTRFILSRFHEQFTTSVIDVGCYEAPLRRLIPKAEYFGIDIVGDPDLVCNLEEIEKIPVANKSYDTACCFEVLEHLDSFHRIFEDLFRVARNDVLVSLPNCWCSARRPVEKGRGSIAHYGLPQACPVDRHKWFINTRQIIKFFEDYASSHSGITLVSIVAVENERPALVRSLRKLKHGGDAYLNRYIHTVVGHFSLGENALPT